MDKDFLIRECRKEDMPFIADISENTWEGHDFLDEIFDEWLKDGNLWVLETQNKVIGTVKISFYPCQTLWLEGLRVHKNSQGRGWGRILYDFTAEKVRQILSSGKIQSAEFATYYLNEESLSLTTRDGFAAAEYFTSISSESKKFKPCGKDSVSISEDFELFVEKCGYNDHIPLGWEFVKKCGDTSGFLKKKAKLFRFEDKYFIQPKHAFKDIFTPLEPTGSYSMSILPAVSLIAGNSGEDYISMMVPEYSKEMAESLSKVNFKVWEEGKENDVLVMKKAFSP
ncbi:GNAT family N-acetyltransferase [candidate division WOR-3 bacterium]|nr:GNAT family N-acetyltransferase [candidate division WOR-3 bacterium]